MTYLFMNENTKYLEGNGLETDFVKLQQTLRLIHLHGAVHKHVQI